MISKMSPCNQYELQFVENLHCKLCRCLDKSRSGFLRREDLQNIPEFSVNPLCNRVIEAFFWESDEVNFTQVGYSFIVSFTVTFTDGPL